VNNNKTAGGKEMKKGLRLVKVLGLCFLLCTMAVGSFSVYAKKPVKVAMMLKTLANPYWVSMKEGVEASAKKMGVQCDVYAVESEADVQGQLQKLEDIIAGDQYDALCVAPITPTNCISAVVKANAKKIPVVNVDEKFDMNALKAAGGYVVGYATSDNTKVGNMGAQLVIDKIGHTGGVAIIEGQAGATSGEIRRDGAKQIFLAKKVKILDIQPGDWDRQKSLDVATNLINKYGKELKGIFCANDTMALGVLQAMKNTGRMDIALVSTDANPEVRTAIAAGELQAVVQSPQGIGTACLEMAVKAFEKGNPGSLNSKPEERYIAATIVKK
jgi:D-allose transport system substrate-binding protein